MTSPWIRGHLVTVARLGTPHQGSRASSPSVLFQACWFGEAGAYVQTIPFLGWWMGQVIYCWVRRVRLSTSLLVQLVGLAGCSSSDTGFRPGASLTCMVGKACHYAHREFGEGWALCCWWVRVVCSSVVEDAGLAGHCAHRGVGLGWEFCCRGGRAAGWLFSQRGWGRLCTLCWWDNKSCVSPIEEEGWLVADSAHWGIGGSWVLPCQGGVGSGVLLAKIRGQPVSLLWKR